MSEQSLREHLNKSRKSALNHNDANFMHGKLFSYESSNYDLERPGYFKNTSFTNRKPRDDHEAPYWLTATEFQDKGQQLEIKAAKLAELLKMSKKTVLYTGAGISASVIGQAARSSINKQGWVGKGTQAQPTKTHVLLSQLVRGNYIHSWIQQNHDGLPQKAGCPQHRINEIHGSWFDPSNPVVKYSGNLKTDLYNWMTWSAENADLVIALGTSLGGLNADQMVEKCSKRKDTLGSVMINLQQTPLDGLMTLRIFGTTDDVLSLVVEKLRSTEDTPGVTPLDDYDRFLNQHVATVDMPIRFPTKIAVPFDKFGNRLTESDGKTWTNIGEDLERFNGEAQSASSKIQNKQNWTIWDLSKNSKVKLHKDNNCVGSQQPSYVNLPGKTGSVHGFDQYSRAIVIKFDIMGKIRHVSLGEWWIEAAMKGKVGCLPFVNVRPEMA